MAALKAHDLAGAYRALAEAYRQAKDPETLYQLAVLALAEDRQLDAYDLFRRYLAGRPDQGPAEKTKVAEARRVTAQSPPPAGELEVIGDAGALVTIDRRLVGSLPLPARCLLSPGPHKVLVEQGPLRAEADVKSQAGRVIGLRVSLDTGGILASRLPAVLPIINGDGLLPNELEPLRKSVEQAIENDRMSVFPLALALLGAPTPADCMTTQSCQLLLAERNEVDWVLVADVKRRGTGASGAFSVSAKLLDTSVGDLAVVLAHECEACDAPAATAALGQVAGQLLTQGTARPRGTLEVRSHPVGAEVLLDDQPVPVGVTPFKHAAWAGSHNILLRAAGYQPRRSSLLVPDAAPATLEVTLSAKEQEAPPPPSPPPLKAPPPMLPSPPPLPARTKGNRPRWRLGLGGAVLASGLVAAGLGISAAVINGSCIMPPPLAGQQCPAFYDTQGAAGALLGVGATLTVTGVIILAWPGSN